MVFPGWLELRQSEWGARVGGKALCIHSPPAMASEGGSYYLTQMVFLFCFLEGGVSCSQGVFKLIMYPSACLELCILLLLPPKFWD